ncbi:hypothetical protein ACOSP7_001501 [Xanthoceras sorbifolium]
MLQAYRANLNLSSEPPQTIKDSHQPTKDPLQGFEWEDSCKVDLVLGGFCRQDDERPESEPVDPKIATFSSLVNQNREIKQWVKERKEWVHRKVIQAAEKLNNGTQDVENGKGENSARWGSQIEN